MARCKSIALATAAPAPLIKLRRLLNAGFSADSGFFDLRADEMRGRFAGMGTVTLVTERHLTLPCQ